MIDSDQPYTLRDCIVYEMLWIRRWQLHCLP